MEGWLASWLPRLATGTDATAVRVILLIDLLIVCGNSNNGNSVAGGSIR